MAPSSNQGSTPQCAAYALCGILEYEQWARTGILKQINPEPYYREAKKIDGIKGGGTTLNAIFEAGKKLGGIPKDARAEVIKSRSAYVRALHRDGPVLLGINATSDLADVGPDGWYFATGKVLGGHAIVGEGYDDIPDEPDVKPFDEGQNSWGELGYAWRGHIRSPQEVFWKTVLYGLTWYPRLR